MTQEGVVVDVVVVEGQAGVGVLAEARVNTSKVVLNVVEVVVVAA